MWVKAPFAHLGEIGLRLRSMLSPPEQGQDQPVLIGCDACDHSVRVSQGPFHRLVNRDSCGPSPEPPDRWTPREGTAQGQSSPCLTEENPEVENLLDPAEE